MIYFKKNLSLLKRDHTLIKLNSDKMDMKSVKDLIHVMQTTDKTLQSVVLQSNLKFKFKDGYCYTFLYGANVKFSCVPKIKIADDGWNNEYVEIGYQIRIKPSEIYEIILTY